MKKYRTTIIVTFTIITIIIIIGLSIYHVLEPFMQPDKDKMEKYFKRDRKDIILITNYFANSNYSSIYINSLTVYLNKDRIKIEDESVIMAIDRLLKKGYSVIGKDSNTIHFQKWTRGSYCIGIAYSINGKDEPILQYLTHIEPLSENGWYFYEEDYNEWKYQNDFIIIENLSLSLIN